ncbi:amino acid ABC transporter ATP-binding protein [Nitratireductor mangrovi]|uniref:Amino acid ABC transporter ATP-binding protein n=1 Tax=Nitratireductor mangrovi TaxID=2599600 RepID=A0A5B8KTK2_9HYPH|nr:amino acid ABC transporter ATP-binding protein [Nitratireductor mangrovi]QDY98935.1 amino acid ABC transporter ATP-binding protein [Nitratireductor mangrovi]
MADPVLSLTGLEKSFDGHTVFANVDLQVMPGDRIAILGASGSGKSTLLRCINVLETPDGGAIEIGGKPVGDGSRGGPARFSERELCALRQRVGMVFQQFNLFPHMTVAGNVAEGLVTVRGIPAAKARERALAELKRVGLADKADTYPSRLSGGQKQRVAIARALAMDPEILLFDEPTSALDPALVGEVLSVIEHLANEGRTMLLVTHEIGFAYHVATKIVFLAEGGIYETGTPDEVLKHPKRPLTRQFLAEHQRFQF